MVPGWVVGVGLGGLGFWLVMVSGWQYRLAGGVAGVGLGGGGRVGEVGECVAAV